VIQDGEGQEVKRTGASKATRPVGEKVSANQVRRGVIGRGKRSARALDEYWGILQKTRKKVSPSCMRKLLGGGVQKSVQDEGIVRRAPPSREFLSDKKGADGGCLKKCDLSRWGVGMSWVEFVNKEGQKKVMPDL